ncbi:MAG: 3-phosphoshikimate 1-carboxyvinyltransferase [Fluviicola sp.]|nr:MAG: 3-phosphoshikimate 1-carboxyvinyltransferase [Fluviicola sp.]
MQKIDPVKSVSGKLVVPSSKSYAQRAIAIAALSEYLVCLENLTDCDDVVAAQQIIQSLGAKIQRNGKDLNLLEGIKLDSKEHVKINCGESGLSTRLFSAFSLLFENDFTVTGHGSIMERTMDMVIEALEQFGKSVTSKDGCLPLVISGETKTNEIHIDGAVSSQLLTGLLIVTPGLTQNTTIHVKNLKSIPYIDMTLEILSDFGIEIRNENYEIFEVKGSQVPKRKKYQVEGDWSGASFLIVAAAIAGKIELEGLNPSSRQADMRILDALTAFGAEFNWKEDVLNIKQNENKAFTFDATHCPDLFPPLAVLAACSDGTSVIKGTSRLEHKESNRALTIKEEFEKLGVEIQLKPDEMHIVGNGESLFIKGGKVSSRNDHRIAMALSLFGLRTTNPILIEHPEAINKSYPDYFKDISSVFGA